MTILDSRTFQTQIPSAPLWLGLAGVLPFVWGASKRLERRARPAGRRLAWHRLCWPRPTADLWRGDLIVHVRGSVGLRLQSG